MLTSLKAFATVAVVCAGCIGIPATLWKANTFVTTHQPEIRTITRKIPKPVVPNTNRGNCDVEQLTPEHKKFLLSQGHKGSFYIEISCEDTGTTSGAGALSRNWTGLFPAQLLKNGENLSIEEKLNLKTEGTSNSEVNKTTFSGQGMAKVILGEWREDSISWGDESIKPLSFSEDSGNKSKLYLIFN